MKRDDGSDPTPGQAAGWAGEAPGAVADIPVAAGSVRWERPTVRSFWNALADPEREALAAAGVEEFFRPGAVLCRAGDDTSQVMIIDSGWAEAEELYRQVTADRTRVLGQGHPSTGAVRAELAQLTADRPDS